MEKGTVKFFNNTKGFGFICEEGTGQDYFVHSSGLAAPVSYTHLKMPTKRIV